MSIGAIASLGANNVGAGSAALALDQCVIISKAGNVKVVSFVKIFLESMKSGVKNIPGALKVAYHNVIVFLKYIGRNSVNYSQTVWKATNVFFHKVGVMCSKSWAHISKFLEGMASTANKTADGVRRAWNYALPYIKQGWTATASFLKTPMGMATSLLSLSIVAIIIGNNAKSGVTRAIFNSLAVVAAISAGILISPIILL